MKRIGAYALTLCGLLIFRVEARAQYASDCKHRILFIPQSHAKVLNGTLEVPEEFKNKIERSQFAIAGFLARNKGTPIFSEQVSHDLTVQTASPDFRRMAAQVKTMFPDGLPRTFEELTEQQRSVLARAGGDLLSFILRDTERLHRVVENDQIEEDLINKVSDWAQKHPQATHWSPEMMEIIYNQREKLALEQITNYFERNPSQRDVILVYGGDHAYTFRTHSDQFPGQCIFTPYEFLKDLPSPYQTGGDGSSGAASPAASAR